MKKIHLLVSGAICLGFLLLISYYMIAMSRLPADDGDLGEIKELIILPERPGTLSLVLTGPIIKPLIFAIDLSMPDIHSLDWTALADVDITADVKILANVDPDGSLSFDPVRDVICPGHTKAGEMISRVLQTWSFKPYKVGSIIIRFNVGAIGKKLTIDISKLVLKEGIESDTPIKIGKLYFIENGLKRSEVKIISW